MDKAGVPVIVAGDFNMTMNKKLYRLPAGGSADHASGSPLLQFCGEMGLVDIWRGRHLEERQFSCHSRTHL